MARGGKKHRKPAAGLLCGQKEAARAQTRCQGCPSNRHSHARGKKGWEGGGLCGARVAGRCCDDHHWCVAHGRQDAWDWLRRAGTWEVRLVGRGLVGTRLVGCGTVALSNGRPWLDRRRQWVGKRERPDWPRKAHTGRRCVGGNGRGIED
jgi:hypothetical protein